MTAKIISVIVIVLFLAVGMVLYVNQNPSAPDTTNLELDDTAENAFQNPMQNQQTQQQPNNPNQQNTTTTVYPTPESSPSGITEQTRATIKTSKGDIVVSFFPDDSPKTVANFVKLAQSGFYNDIVFHRIIDDFMVQGGDPKTKTEPQSAWGTGGPGYQFEDEINDHKLVYGSLAMANSGPNTNGSQFFIVTTESTAWLDGKHTNFGKVEQGMDIVERLVIGDKILGITIE